MDTVTIETLGERLSEVARRVEQGETVVVTRDGKPVLDLVPHRQKGGIDCEAGRRHLARRGVAKLATYIAPDFDAALSEDFLISPIRDKDSEAR